MRTVTVEVDILDAASVEAAVSFLNKHITQLKRELNKLLTLMCGEGEAYAINAVGHIDTGATLTSIMGYRQGKYGIIQAGANAIWIEFGTGIAKNGTGISHPWPLADDGGNIIYGHGEYGDGHGFDPNGWWYFDESVGDYRHTMGIEMNPFMYNTAQHLAGHLKDYAGKVFI